MKAMSNLMVAGRLALLGAFLSIVVSGCGSSPPVRFYTLTPTVEAGAPDAGEQVMVGLGPLRMPEYLNRSQMVVQGSGAELEVDEFVRWAEPLGDSLLRVVSSDVDNSLAGVTVVTFPWETVLRRQVDYRIGGQVIRFESDQSGRVVLEVQWGIADRDDRPMLPVRRSRHEAMATSVNDAESVASAMNAALGMFSREIVTELEALLAETT